MMKHIKTNEIGILTKKGDFLKVLPPGSYFENKLFGYSIEIYDRTLDFGTSWNPFLLISLPGMKDYIEVVEVLEGEICIHYEEDVLTSVLNPGKYFFWKGVLKHRFEKINISSPEISGIEESILSNELLKPYYLEHTVYSFQFGILMFNGKYQRRLDAGRYRYWNGKNQVVVYTQDKRIQSTEIVGQELLTEDRINLRLNFTCQYQVVNPERALLEIQNLQEQLHTFLQIVLREFISNWKLDSLMEKREEASQLIVEKLSKKEEHFGIKVHGGGIKDIILPGEMKDILNTVIIAEKKAQANLITRREETASTRSLLNTAKLLEENPTLKRLKELEFLEKVLEKVGSIHLGTNTPVLDQIQKLLG